MKFWGIVLLALIVSAQAWAKLDFAVTIPVDVDAEDSVAAKDKAMIEAQREAFFEVAQQLTSAENVQKLKELSDNVIMHFVQSVSVEDEKSGGTKYKANLTVQVNEQLLKDYLLENEMIQAEITELLVIPVFQYENKPILWERNNEWLEQWRSKGLIKFGSMQMRTLTDNYRNIEGLNAESVLYMNADMYTRIAEMSGNERIYVVFANVLANGDLKVVVKNEKNKTEDFFSVYNDGQTDLMDKAIEKSVMLISNMERNAKGAENIAVLDSVNAVYVYQNMKDWLVKSKMIADLGQVEGVDTKSFGGGKVNFSIQYSGSIDDLWLALQEIGLSHEARGNYFIIR